MKKTLRFCIFAIFALTTGLVACGPKSNPQQTNKVLTAYRLIDEQRSDEAIALMENSLAEDPNNDNYKIVLASAYAHKAGVKIQKLAPVINQSDKLKSLSNISHATGDNHDNLDQTAHNMADLFSTFSAFFEIYAAIPSVDDDQAIYLKQAIDVLGTLSQVKQENALYKAILEVILLKQYLADGFVGDVPQTQQSDLPAAKDQKVTCKIDFDETKAKLAKLGKLLIDIFDDMAVANPKSAEEMHQTASRTTTFINDLITSTSAVTAADEAASIFLKETAIQHGLGKIIKCGGS